MKKNINKLIVCFVFILVAFVPSGVSDEQSASPLFKQEELDQLVAPIALYPDSLLSQIFMASTYPLEVVQADRWTKQNKDLKGDTLAAALEKQNWDPSVKSLVNFPQVLSMMSEQLDWTQKLGDAFLAQQKDVMNAVQKLRNKAYNEGNLKTTKEQVVTNEQQTIVIQPSDPQVIYVPAYDPTVVYGGWPYPAYPPYYYYPPGYVAGSNLLSFGLGFALGSAWGYSWGHCDWHGGDVDIDFDQNFNFNRDINRDKYKRDYQNRGQLGQNGKGKWQHNPADRKGVAYRDQATAQKFNRASTTDAIKSREAYRGRTEMGRQELASGSADRYKGQQGVTRPESLQGRNQAPSRDMSSRNLSNRGVPSTGQRVSSTPTSRTGAGNVTRNYSSYNRGGALQGMDRGSTARNYSNRGQVSRQSMSRPSGGGFQGGGRGGGGRGGGGRGGGGRR